MRPKLKIEYVPLSTFKGWARNPKQHSFADLHRSISRFNFNDPVCVNKRTGTIVEGHGRIDVLQQKKESGDPPPGHIIDQDGEWLVPTFFLDMDEREAEAYALAHNRLVETGGWSEGNLVEVLKDLAIDNFLEGVGWDQDDVTQLLHDIPLPSDIGNFEIEEESIPEDPIAYGVPDIIFPSDNKWGIPTLDLNFQAEFVERPVVAWGSQARSSRMGGIWHFYVDDNRFSGLLKNPMSVIATRCISAVEPNFSIYEQTPPAIALHQIYWKRWLARLWQKYHIRIFVDLNVTRETYELNFLGVPRGWRSYATRGYQDRIDSVQEEHERAMKHAETEEIVFFVYGGGQTVQELCAKHGWIWIMDRMTEKMSR